MTVYPTDGGSVNRNYTSDQQPRPNTVTREEFLHRVLHSGEVTKIAQHLALVIFLLAEGHNQVKASVRDLERITGWTRTAIRDHLAELEIFMSITFGSGRAKTLFELQGVIEDAIASAVVAASRSSTPATNLVARQPDTMAASQPDANPVVASQGAAVVASQPATTKESFPPYPPSKKSSPIATHSLCGSEEPRDVQQIQVGDSVIRGPGFTLSLAAIDMAASLIGMPAERARKIAEICAHDWVANGQKPQHPMAMVKAALKSEFNSAQIQEVRLEKARTDGRQAFGTRGGQPSKADALRRLNMA